MTLESRAYLVLQDGANEGVFEFNAQLEISSELDKSFIMAERGQYVREIFNQANIIGDIDNVADRRAGYHIDGGAGSWQETLSFEVHQDNNVSWGDGSGGNGADNVTERDASGTGIPMETRKNVFELWLARTLTDSRNPARLHFGEWTNGRFNESGVFNQPLPVAVTNHNLEPDIQEPSNLTGSITMQVITLFADIDPPDWLADSNIGTFIQQAAEALGVIPDE